MGKIDFTKIYSVVGKVLWGIAGAIIAFVAGGFYWTIPGIIVGVFAGHFLEKCLYNPALKTK